VAKYQQVFEEMISQNKEVFDSFKKIHEEYSKNPESCRVKYNQEGEKV
jgi:hypothetical protein